MADDPSELRRKIDRLQYQINEMKAVAEADKETRRAEMQAMRSDLAESLTRLEASNKESLARNEASSKEGLAQNREAIARNEAAISKLRTDIYKGIFAAVAAAAAFVALLEYVFRAA